MKKLLLLSISAGSGHVRAAEAIKNYASINLKDLEVRHIDVADYISLPMKKAILVSYDMLAKQVPDLWGFLYNKTNSPKISKQFKKINKKLKKINARALHKYIEDFEPDHILSTHFLCPDLLDVDKLQDIELSTLITDYDFHELWFSPVVKNFFVSTEKIGWKLEKRGVSKTQIKVSGIPVDPKFYEYKNSETLKEKYGIEKNIPVILVLSGGQGMGHADKLASELFKLKNKHQIITISGNNKKLFSKLKKLTPPNHISHTVVGWTDKIHEYMSMADIIVSKSGGLTVTESVLLNKKLIVVDPIPGQEEANAHFLLENGLGFIAHTTDDLLFYVDKNIKEELIQRENVGNKEPAHAAKNILEKILN